jgi:hypothetical protein
MSEVSPSVWQQNDKGEWKLYFNIESVPISKQTSLNKDQSKYKKSNALSEMNIILGTLVMTPKGIGRLIKNNSGMATIRLKDGENEELFPIGSITNYFNCFIIDYSNCKIDITRLKLKVSGKVEDIFTELTKLKKINSDENNYSLVYNKNKLNNENTFEQLNLMNNAKLLITSKNKIAYSVSRYINIRQYWYIYPLDGICFSSSQKIKLIGVGLFGCHDNNKIINGTLRILDGPSLMSKTIIEENVEVQPSNNKLGAITKIYFSKPVFCGKNQDYSIIFTTKTNGNSFYGTNGKAEIEGEKGVFFSFKRVQGKNGGTGVESGNFPELYYYLH